MAIDTVFEPEHDDRLSVLQLNHDSSKLVTASIDRRVAVYEIDESSSTRKQIEGFTAHDADIRDVKWLHPSTGTHFVTLGSDMQMRIWSEDPYQAPMSGRRFKRVATIKSQQLVPFTSVDVKTVGDSTYIAVIDRQGLLSLYEPSNPDEYHEWTLVDQFHVYLPVPGRNEHTSFRIQFDPNRFPLPFQQYLSDDEQQLTIVVTAMDEVKLYRSTANADAIAAYMAMAPQASPTEPSVSHRLMMFEVFKMNPGLQNSLENSAPLLRDVAFGPAGFNGSDMIALASMDGTVFIYQIKLTSTAHLQLANTSLLATQSTQRSAVQPQQSNLTSALNTSNALPNAPQHSSLRSPHSFNYTHHAQLIFMMQHAHTDAWSVKWDTGGETLLSSGSDGVIKIWRQFMDVDGSKQFTLYAEQTGEDEDSGEDTSEEDQSLSQ